MGIKLLPGVYPAVLGLCGAGAVVIWPNNLWIGYSLFLAAGALALWGLRLPGKRHIWAPLGPLLRNHVLWRLSPSPPHGVAPDSSHKRGLAGAWVPLPEVLRYLVERSEWGKSVQIERGQSANSILQREFVEAAARGDITVRGRRQAGPASVSPANASEEIPPFFWSHAFMQPFAEMLANDPMRSAAATEGKFAVQERRAYREIVVKRSALEDCWPPSPSFEKGPLEAAFEAYVHQNDDQSSGPQPDKPRRRKLIDDCRRLIANYRGEIGPRGQRSALESSPSYLALRKHLSDEFLQRVKSDVIRVDPLHPGPLTMRAFADELDRLETLWGLDD